MAQSFVALALLAEVLTAGGARPVTPVAAGSVYRTPRQAADAALDQLVALGPDGGVAGIPTTGGARPRRGTPIAEANVRLDELKDFAPDADPSRLVHATGAFLVPVLSGREVVAAVTVVPKGNGYAAAGVGDEPLARALGAWLARRRPGATRLVRIPALHLAFVTEGDGRALALVPISSDARFGLEEGKAERAAAVFERLVPAARAQAKDVPG